LRYVDARQPFVSARPLQMGRTGMNLMCTDHKQDYPLHETKSQT